MYYYEIVYIVHPALQAGHLDDTINKINDKIKQLKGKVLFFENWGKKKLSYLIQKQKFGTYIILQCQLNGKDVGELNNDFEHNANIMRHLVSKIDEDHIMEQKNVQPEISNQNVEEVPEEKKSSKDEKKDDVENLEEKKTSEDKNDKD
tara:strand:+ start:752 stop:1195 length:444 start_codon:yes stop_codon:yes gene_type:complete